MIRQGRVWQLGMVLMMVTTGVWAVPSKISEVMLYDRLATITRTASVDVSRGNGEVVIEKLPRTITADSVVAKMDKAVKIGSIEIREVIEEQLVAKREKALATEIESLMGQQRELEDDIKVAEMELSFLRSQSTHSQDVGTNGAIQLSPQVWKSAQAALKEGGADALSRIRKAQDGVKELGVRIKKLQSELAQIRTGARRYKNVVIHIESEKAQKDVPVELRYTVRNAGWQPQYELRLDTETSIQEIGLKASVWQNTGEDWEGVKLTVSTSRPSYSTQPITLVPWFIDFKRPVPPPMPQRRMKSSVAPMMESMDMENFAAGAMVAEEPAAVENAGEFTGSWTVSGLSTVESDNERNLFALGEYEADVSLSARVVPRLNKDAFLFAQGVYKGDLTLPPAQASLYLDGEYRGKTHLGRLATNEALELGYGVDQKLEVKFKDEGVKKGESGYVGKDNFHEHRYHYSVTNRHSKALKVVIFDQLPVSRHEDIEVSLLAESSQPTHTDFEGNKGVLAWEYTLKPKEGKGVGFGYRVTYPLKKELSGI